jgi:hypothetical protein
MKTKVIVVTLLFLVCGLLVGTQVEAQLPPGKPPGNAQRAAKQTTKPNAAAAQDAAPDTDPEVVGISRQNLPQDPLRIAINNAVQKGMQEAKLNPAATQAMQNATGNAAQNATQTTVQNAAPNAASNLAPNTSMPQNTSPNTAQSGSPNTNSSSNTTPNATPNTNRAPNPRPPAAAPAGPIPPAINAGIEAMVSSKASLENAGNKWGGHKDKAIKLIDQALEACGQTPTPDNGGGKPSPADETPAMQAGLTQLTAAQKHFMSAKNAWGGRRDQALAVINQALTEVQAGIDFAKNHNTY